MPEPVFEFEQGPVPVIGMGIGDSPLGDEALAWLMRADAVVGAEHHLQRVRDLLPEAAEVCEYPSPFSELKPWLQTRRQRRIVILASGDPLFYGIGAWLNRTFGAWQFRYLANVSSVQAAFHRAGLPWQDAVVVSLHGRPLSSLRRSLQAGRTLALLTDSNSQPHAVAAEVAGAGYTEATVWVAEALGLAQERVRQFQLNELLDGAELDFHSLQVTLIVLPAELQSLLQQVPESLSLVEPTAAQASNSVTSQSSSQWASQWVIPDRAFVTGREAGRGLLTKAEVRLAILAQLAPARAETGWDVGAGCGGVAVDWARRADAGQVHAIECHSERLQHLEANRQRFGVVDRLHLVAGRAPQALQTLPAPDKIFVGGSGGELAEILDVCWRQLRPGGRLVLACVTENSRAEALSFDQRVDTDHQRHWQQIAVSRGETLAGNLLLRPQLPVLLVTWQKSTTTTA